MAIIDKFEVVIHIDGKPTKEYDANGPNTDGLAIRDPPGVVTRCVEAICGAPFGIEMKVHKQRRHHCDLLAWRIYLDGEIVKSQKVNKNEYSYRQDFSRFVDRARPKGKNQAYQKFAFENLAIRESDLNETIDQVTAEKYSELGSLRIEVWRQNFRPPPSNMAIKVDQSEKQISSTNNVQREDPHGQTANADAVPEKALKGRSVYVSTGFHHARSVLQRSTSETQKMKHTTYPDKKPLARFIFKYRTKKGLRDEGIVPRTPLLEERPLETLNRAELLERLRRLEAQHAEPNVKPEDRSGVKRGRTSAEPDSPRARKMIKVEDRANASGL